MTRERLSGLAAAMILCASAASCGSSSPGEGDAAPASRLVPPATLAAQLPNPPDWQRGEVESADAGPPAPASHAATSYTRDAARIDMEITDTDGNGEFIEAAAKVAGTDFNRVSANGYVRGVMIDGFPAIEVWNHEDHLGEITVLLDARFVVHATASGLDGIETLRAFVQQVPLAGIPALAPR
jgi:hypothetical protein